MKKFDLTTIYNENRPLSWSGISSFEWNKGQWYRKYVLKELPEITDELRFGSFIDKKIQDNPKFLPKLVRYPVLQHEMRGTYDGIPLLGFADTFRPLTLNSGGVAFTKKTARVVPPSILKPAIRDYKTGRKPWDQKRANETGQLTMYLLMLYLRDKIKPEDVECYIDWLPTHIEEGKIAFIKEGDIRTFKTKRTMKQVLEFCQRIKTVWAEMEEYASRQADVVPHVPVKRPVSSFLK